MAPETGQPQRPLGRRVRFVLLAAVAVFVAAAVLAAPDPAGATGLFVAAPVDELQGQERVDHHLAELSSLLRAGFVVVAITAIGVTYWKTRSLIPLLTTALLAGVFLWAADNPGWWADRVADEHGNLDQGDTGASDGQGVIDRECMTTPPAGYQFGEHWWCGDWRCFMSEGTTHPGCQLVER